MGLNVRFRAGEGNDWRVPLFALMLIPMKKILGALLVLAIGLGLFLVFRPAPRYANFPPRHGQAWIAFGDSLTAGFGASEGNDYPTLLGKRIGVPSSTWARPALRLRMASLNSRTSSTSVPGRPPVLWGQ